MNIEQIVKARHTSKAYDGSRKLSAEQQQQVFDLLRYSPSSVNSQPWHFFAITSDEGKQQILPAIMETNQSKVLNASMVIVFTTQAEITDTHLNALLAQEKKDGRFRSEDSEANQDKGRRFFIGLNSETAEQQRDWMARQAYISLGFLLLGAPGLGLDATPIEGFHADKMDELLGLKEKNLTSVVVATVGYRSEGDFNADLPKSRLAQELVITQL